MQILCHCVMRVSQLSLEILGLDSKNQGRGAAVSPRRHYVSLNVYPSFIVKDDVKHRGL